MIKVKAADLQVEGLILSDIDFTLQTFGEFLRSVRRAKRLSIRDFEEQVHKTRAYLSDIERGKSKPPDRELLDIMIEQLNLADFPKVVNRLYDLAAIERNAVSDDLRLWIMQDEVHRDLLRKCRDKKLTSAQINRLLEIVEEM